MNERRPIIGIDLGTTRSVAAYVGADGHVTSLPNRDGEVLTPSCVYIEPDGTARVGRRALQAGTGTPDRLAEAFKRHMGRDNWSWSVDGLTFSAPALSAFVLRRLVEDAERVVGPIGGAVVTVPAYFGDAQRSATLDAAVLADLNVVTLINEPTAAALAGAFESYITAGGDGADLTTAAIAATAPGVSVLCDLGGGTFDVTVIRIDGSRFDVLATGGDRVGGRDFDEYIVEAMYRHIFDSNSLDPYHDPTALARMRITAEQAKHTLTVKDSVQVPMPYPNVPAMTLTRERFEKDSRPLIDRTRRVIGKVMSDAGLAWSGVDALLLAGGASRMPMFRRMAAAVSGLQADVRLQPDLIVAHGAAVYAAIGEVQGEGGVPAAQGGSSVVADLRPPESHDAPAAAGQAAFDPGFAAAAASVRVTDVNSRSLGVVVYSPEEAGEVNAVVIPRNSRLPALKSRVFGTHEENQQRVVLPIVEGEERSPSACTEVGRCIIDPLPPNLPKGAPVEVTFSYDVSGRVCVRAEEPGSRTAAQTVLDRRVDRPRDRIDELAEIVARYVLD